MRADHMQNNRHPVKKKRNKEGPGGRYPIIRSNISAFCFLQFADNTQ
ncbi:hypothetical protein SRABI27_00833 [Pedobacter sp. Bi27]|nr:hypothetical protein SRABI27_00833 [Pedobacter sp. Bi27]